jgi:hypothetical protein
MDSLTSVLGPFVDHRSVVNTVKFVLGGTVDSETVCKIIQDVNLCLVNEKHYIIDRTPSHLSFILYSTNTLPSILPVTTYHNCPANPRVGRHNSCSIGPYSERDIKLHIDSILKTRWLRKMNLPTPNSVLITKCACWSLRERPRCPILDFQQNHHRVPTSNSAATVSRII